MPGGARAVDVHDRLGAEGGRINFNRPDATTLSSAIAGNGAVYQLGSGTTILAACRLGMLDP